MHEGQATTRERATRVILALVAVFGLTAALSACGDDSSSDDDADATTETTAAPDTSADASSSTTVPPFEGLDPAELPDDLDAAFLDALQRCYVPETVGEEVFAFEGDPGDVEQLTAELRPGFVALRDCLVGRAPASVCVVAIEPLSESQSDDEFSAVLQSFGECATEELN